jgi:hypothetical protein
MRIASDITLKENPTIKYFDFELDSDSGFANWLNGEKLLFTSEILDEELNDSLLSPGKPYTRKNLMI